MSQPAAALPLVRSIRFTRPLAWLALGWRDLWRCRTASLGQGLALAGLSALLWAFGGSHFWWLAGALSGFLVVAPVLATGFYVLSRALERGEPADVRVVLRTWLFWQRNHRSRWDHGYWSLVRFGLLLALAGTGWVLVSAALITLLASEPVRSPQDFLQLVVLAPDSRLFALWLLLGSLLAAPMFASSVVSMPLLLDRRVGLWQAVDTSWKTVLANPATMALWTVAIVVLTLLGMASGMLGLALTVPVLGHASWHAYRELVDASMLPEREPPTGADGGAGHPFPKAIAP